MKNQREIEVFINCVQRYFNHISEETNDLIIGTPYLVDSDEELGFEYTGMINISGETKGSVFFSATSLMLKYILLSHEENNFSKRVLRDMSGEIANTIAGNARQFLGDAFLISPPTLLVNKISSALLMNNSRCSVLPISWRNNKALLIVNLND